MDHRGGLPAQGLTQGAKFVFRVADQHIVLRVENEKSDLLLGKKGFAGTRHPQLERRLIQQIGLVAQEQVVGDGVLSKVDAALVLDLLHLEGHEHRQALGGEGAKGVDFSHPDGQCRVEAVHLLELEHRHLAHLLAGHRLDRLRVALQLLIGIRHDDQGEDAEHHPLVAGGQVV